MRKTIRYENKLNVIGHKIKLLRENSNLSLEQLAKQLQLCGLDISKSSIQNIESGKRVIKEYEFYIICKFFNISMEEMLSEYIKSLENS